MLPTGFTMANHVEGGEGGNKNLATIGENSSGSRSLGSTDTYSDVVSKPRREPFGVQKWKWVPKNSLDHKSTRDPIQRHHERDECRLSHMDSREEIIELGMDDVFHIEDEKSFCLMGRFAGRFPGMVAVRQLTQSWKVECTPEKMPNGHVIFRFLKEEDREAILTNGPYLLYGKRLILEVLQERVGMGFEDYCFMPIWIRLPNLPSSCWHKNALSKIATKIGKPICMDDHTSDNKRGLFARILVDVNCSAQPRHSVSLRLPDGLEFEQKLIYEHFFVFCSRCGSEKHLFANCPLERVEANIKRRLGLEMNNQDSEKALDEGEDEGAVQHQDPIPATGESLDDGVSMLDNGVNQQNGILKSNEDISAMCIPNDSHENSSIHSLKESRGNEKEKSLVEGDKDDVDASIMDLENICNVTLELKDKGNEEVEEDGAKDDGDKSCAEACENQDNQAFGVMGEKQKQKSRKKKKNKEVPNAEFFKDLDSEPEGGNNPLPQGKKGVASGGGRRKPTSVAQC